MTITGGNTATDGGGLYNNGTTMLTDCTVSGNTAGVFGGGIAQENPYATLTLNRCTVSGNSANTSGGVDQRRHGDADQLHRQR